MNLQDLSKDALVEIHRHAFGTVGDTARTPKSTYVEKLAALDAEKLEDAMRKSKTEKAVSAVAAVGDDAGAAQQLLSLIRAMAAGSIDEGRVREIVADAVRDIQPRTETLIVSPAGEVRIKEHTHPVFQEVTRAVSAGLNVLLVGPAGCGKTHLAAQVARALSRDFGTLHCTAGASESQLTGWLLPVAEHGRFEYVPAQFVTLYEQGHSLFLLDEIDAADPNMLLVINAALANGHLHIPQRYACPTAPRGEGAAIIAAANTYGHGADLIYAGRNQLDAATLDRFYPITMDYDRDLEQQLAPSHICDWAWALRDKVNSLKLRRVVSTRTIQKGAAMVAAGADWEAVKVRLLSGWTRDELAKVQS